MIQAGSKFGNYEIIRQLGAGGMSDVYEAVDLTLERRVALKIMPPDFSADDERIRRFRKEALAVAALDHPGIVTIFEVNRAEGCDYYSMTLARHGNLKQLIHKGSLNAQRSLHIVRAVAEALGHAHEQGIVHRDIKPENILFTRPDQPVLADFGIVKRLGSNTKITAAGTSVGTPFYMSPEQAQALKVDPRSDIYSLGVVLYEMLNGKVPFDATTTIGIALSHVNDPIPKLPGGLALMQPLVERMMAKEPRDRFRDATELVAAIDAYLELLGDEASGRVSAQAAAQRAVGITAPPPGRAGTAGPTPSRSPKPTRPPPGSAQPRKPRRPPPGKAPAAKPPPAAARPRPKSAPLKLDHDPATEFELMVLTPDPAAADRAPATPARPADPEPVARDRSRPPRPAVPSDPVPAPPAGSGPQVPSPRSAPPRSSAKPPPAAAGSARPTPPRRRVNTGSRPPVHLRASDIWRARELDASAKPAWYRRPLTYLIAAGTIALIGIALLLGGGSDRDPSPLDLITGRGGPGTVVIGAREAVPPTVHADAPPQDETEAAADRPPSEDDG